MPVNADLVLPGNVDATLVIDLAPAVPIGGWNVRLLVQKRLGALSSGLVNKSMASGFYGVSGLDITNSGQGQFQATFNAGDTSGMNPGVYAYAVERLDSGNRTMLVQGSLLLMPGGT